MNVPTALVVDDEPAVRELVAHCLRAAGASVLLAPGGREGLELLRRQSVDVLFTDLCLPTLDGISLLREAVRLRPDLASVIMTGYASIESSVEGLRLGVCDYVTKPITQGKIRSALERAVRFRNAVVRPKSHVAAIAPQNGAVPRSELVAHSAALSEILTLVARIAPTTATVLIQGETGVGKGMIAQAIHDQSARAGRPFVHAQCSALSRAVWQQEVYGYDTAAAATAGDQRRGLFELAAGGTLFLDNVDKLPMSVHAGLLDCLQDHCVHKVEGTEPQATDVRVVSATTIDLQAEVYAGRFHRGLHDYLSVVQIHIPPLRYRPDDIKALTKLFAARYRRPKTDPDAAPIRFSDEACNCLLHYDWPGNVRELANVVEHAVLLADGVEIDVADLPESVRTRRHADANLDRLSVPLVGDIKAIERNVIQEVIGRCKGNKAAAARALGMHRRTLYRRLASN